jgi:progesterone-induced-blocking factor 1
MNDKTDDSKRFELNYENMRKGLQLELKKAQEEMVIMKEKVASYDELYRKFKQVEQEKQLMEDKLGFYSNQKEGSNLMSEMYKQSDDMRRKNELLIQDKEYMTRENISLLEKNKRLEDRLDNLEREIV